MLHHQDGIAEVPQPVQGGDQPPVVPHVQPDGRLIQNIEYPHQLTTDLGGQPDSLSLATAQRGGGPGEGQVVQPHVHQEAQAVPDLLEHLGGDFLLGGRKLQLLEEEL